MKQFLLKRGSPRKSQAVSELAIFGALIIAAFAATLSYIQSTNTQQALQMRAFRKAMQLSRQLNKEVSYTIVKDTPVIDVADPFGRPDLSRQTVSSTVVAVTDDPLNPDDDDPDDRGSAQYYEFVGGGPLNRREEIRPIKIEISYPGGNKSPAWIAAPISDVEYQTQKQRRGTLSRRQAGSSISTTPTGSVTTQSTTNLVLEDKAVFEENYLADLRSNIEREPWQKRFHLEDELRATLGSYLNYITGIGVDELFKLFGWKIGACGGYHIVKTAIMQGVSIAASQIFNYIFDLEPRDNKPDAVRITDGYRPVEPISHSASYSQPSQTFSVSQ